MSSARRLRGKVTRKQREQFLDALREGFTLTSAAAAAGRDRRRFWELRVEDPAFNEAVLEAYGEGTEALIDEARRRAIEGWEERVYRASGLVGTVRKFSDSLLLRLLASRDPSWRESANVHVNALAAQVEIDRPVQGETTMRDVLLLMRQQGALPAGLELVDVVDGDAEELRELPPGGDAA